MKYTRRSIYSFAKQISVNFAKCNRDANSDIFEAGRIKVMHILNDKLRNNKQERLLEAMSETMRRTIGISVRVYNECENKDSFDMLIQQRKFHDALLLLAGEYEIEANMVSILMNEISDMEILYYKGEDVQIKRNQMSSRLLDLKNTVKKNGIKR